MKRPRLPVALTTAAATVAVFAGAFAAPASADTAYRIPMFACADGAPGANLVPADTALYVQSGWVSGTFGLVQSAIGNSTNTVTDLRGGVTTVYSPVWGPIEPLAGGGWVAHWRVDLPPLALGSTATVRMSLSFAHPQVDLGLPTSDDDQAGLQYFDLVPAGLLDLVGEPNPTVCGLVAAGSAAAAIATLLLPAHPATGLTLALEPQ
jgi:hypothetical protein